MPDFAHLVEGYARFRAGSYQAHKRRYDALAERGQSPPVMVISCSDSRVDPATIFDTVPGQMFSLRNVASLVPPFEADGGLHGASAAIEFGVTSLEVRHIVVLGHGACGGIAAALAGTAGHAPRSFVDRWMDIVADGRDRVLADAAAGRVADPQRALEFEAIRVGIANLRSFPFVAEREAAGSLKLHGAWFAIASGGLMLLDQASGEFVPASHGPDTALTPTA